MPLASTAARLYAVFATLGLLVIATVMPPFQNADELNHVLRADQISHGGFLARRLSDRQVGGIVDSGVQSSNAPFDSIRFNQTAKVTRSQYAPQPWGQPIATGFPNTAVYPPLFYVPAASALWMARRFQLSVLHGLTLARLAGGAVAVCLGTLAIACSGAAAIWMFTLLLLPMSMALTAAISQDGILLACSALAAALLWRLRQNADRRLFVLAVILLCLVAICRPPYAAFALLLMKVRLPLKERIAGIAVVLASTAIWSAAMARYIVLPIFNGVPVNPGLQFRLLLASPSRALMLFANTWQFHARELSQEFVGTLGWLDVHLPGAYYPLGWSVILYTGLLGLSGLHRSWLRRVDWFGWAGINVAVLGLTLLEYATWDVPGAPVIEGLQGRYFLPPALMLAAFFPSDGWRAGAERWLAWPLLLFPVVTLPVVIHALLIRYYF